MPANPARPRLGLENSAHCGGRARQASCPLPGARSFEAAMREMNRIMDEIEQIYARRKG